MQRAPSTWKPKDPAISAKYFEGAGEVPGVQVWRVENLAPVLVDNEQHGKFHSGDSYLVLKTIPKKVRTTARSLSDCEPDHPTELSFFII